jgi:hypothetical protein
MSYISIGVKMYKLYGYTCHLDDKHINEHKVTRKDVDNVVACIDMFDDTVPIILEEMVRKAENEGECHNALHEFTDWLINSFLEGKATIGHLFLISASFSGNAEEKRQKAKDKLTFLRSTCGCKV